VRESRPLADALPEPVGAALPDAGRVMERDGRSDALPEGVPKGGPGVAVGGVGRALMLLEELLEALPVAREADGQADGGALSEGCDAEGVAEALAVSDAAALSEGEGGAEALGSALPEALACGVGESGPSTTSSTTLCAGAKNTLPAWLATNLQSPPATVAVTLAPATVHAAGVLLISATGRPLVAPQATGMGAGGPHRAPPRPPPSGAQETFCATVPPPGGTLAAPTAAHRPPSAARQLSGPSAPRNAVCQGLAMSELLSEGKNAAPKPGGAVAAVVSAIAVPAPAGTICERVRFSDSAGRKPKPRPPTSSQGPWKPPVMSAPPEATKCASASAPASTPAASAPRSPKPKGRTLSTSAT